jgi:hypothetical protein
MPSQDIIRVVDPRTARRGEQIDLEEIQTKFWRDRFHARCATWLLAAKRYGGVPYTDFAVFMRAAVDYIQYLELRVEETKE